jgi:hypothetical protein
VLEVKQKLNPRKPRARMEEQIIFVSPLLSPEIFTFRAKF